MKYKILTQITDFLSKFKKINNIRRIEDCALLIVFDNSYELIFDLNKSNSAIYKSNQVTNFKEYKAPFDFALKKRFNSSKINSIETMQNNRIIKIETTLNGSYKSLKSILYLEFTGRFTNVILTDECGVIIEALRHCQNEIRCIKVGKTLLELEPIDIKESQCEIIENFDEFFINEFEKIKNKKLNELKNIKLLNLDKKILILKQNLDVIPSKDELMQKSDQLNKNAMLIISNLYRLNAYDREIVLKDENGNSINLKLNNTPKNTASEAFKESKKIKQKAENIQIQRLNLINKIDFLKKLKNTLQFSQDISEINALMPKKSKYKKDTKNIDFIENFYINEFKISVGKNEKGNILLLKESKKDDFWFHLKDIPSSHVIVKTNKQSLNDNLLNFVAKLCVTFSTNERGNYLVDYTKKQNVKVVNGAFVNYINYKTIGVKI